MATSWTTIENTVRAWVKTASGLADGKVIWDTPNVGRPTGTFVSLRIGTLIPVGTDSVHQYDNNAGSPTTQNDLELRISGTREFGLTVQVFAPPASGHSGPAYGDSGALALAAKIQAALALPSTMKNFNAAQISCFDPGRVTYVPAIPGSGTAFEGRAVLEPRFYAIQTISDYSTWIEHVADPEGTYS